MTKVTVTANSAHEAAHALGMNRPQADIHLTFRTADFGKKLLPGLLVRVSADAYLNRECTTLDEALKYIRKLYKDKTK